MKRTLRTTFLVFALIIGILGTSTVAFAAVNGEHFGRVTVSDEWTEIAYDTQGFNCNVEITGYLITLGHRIDVRMLDENGDELWAQNDSCPGLSSRVYRCGADVYSIEVRVDPGVSGTAIALKTDKPAD